MRSLRTLATATLAVGLLLTGVAAPASAMRCNADLGCSNGRGGNPDGGVVWKTGWILVQQADGWYVWVWGTYTEPVPGQCYGTDGKAVGCP